MNAYAYANRDESTHELSYAIAIFENGDYTFASQGRLGFGELVHGAALSMHRLLTYLTSESIACQNIYTNVTELLDRVNSPLIQDELIQEVRAFGMPFSIKLEPTPETDFTFGLFTTPFSIFGD